ncbi:MAG TPA: hypothetical protein VHN20_08000 [Beijerinckiaceae bacterium]|nr:hypothetical protein [Beijerinckiaceae bacterium]
MMRQPSPLGNARLDRIITGLVPVIPIGEAAPFRSGWPYPDQRFALSWH